MLDLIYNNLGLSFLIYFLVESFFYFAIEKQFLKFRSSSNRSLFIVDDHSIGYFAWVSPFIEYAILNRYSFFGYKNMVRNNLRLFSSIFLTIFVALFALLLCKLISGLESQCPDLSLKEFCTATLGFIIGSFIIERKMVYEKWTYLAGLFNKVLEIEIRKDNNEADVMRLCLALDILDMEMWSHSSFSGFFRDEINEEAEIGGKAFFKSKLRERISDKMDTYVSKESAQNFIKGDF